jgi:hypothetical protein
MMVPVRVPHADSFRSPFIAHAPELRLSFALLAVAPVFYGGFDPLYEKAYSSWGSGLR